MTTDALSPTAADAARHPVMTTTRHPRAAVLRDAVELACRAPSVHNTQPWKWVLDGVSLHLYSDPARLLPEADPFGRQLLLSCGAVLDHLKVALAVQGWRALVVRFPDPSRLGHLAAITFTPARFVTPAEHRRVAAVQARRTDRLPFGAPPRWGQFRETLIELLEDYGAYATFLSQDTRNDLAEASRLTAARRRYDSLYRAELHWWTGHAPHADGVPSTVLAAPAEATRVPVGRVFGGGGTATETTYTPMIDESALLVLGTDGDDRLDCLRGGEALSAVLLEATMAGYATCPLTHLTELPASRAVVARLAADGRVPQVVIRIGVGVGDAPDRPRTARRDVSEVFTIRHAGDSAP